ncbi:MAG: hypothetical protein A2X34_09670 [Elusimicrobia bacterium GWC2_51_8]|nr:MAG: hypothetical protein A2X33_10120 [Elusimicrobia bacterium GWA2_51_34]OGR61132.1 MAG: hypothetical protein A2X34_09670 [Elusimicrobia bacterium GWC2_51_8]OGR84718.1 MAG: hypothetical protein A2021_03835 [Elusimicrobia bacterium GWF2_52_66]
MPEEFYTTQTDITAAKVKFYKDYIGGYLIKVLMTFGKCFVADLFCGPGKNGGKLGSPLVLLEEAKRMLASDVLLREHHNPEVKILFNDIVQKYTVDLKAELASFGPIPHVSIVGIENKPFADILQELQPVLKLKIPKFFFLDPFTYSTIQLDDIRQIIGSDYTEVLLFLPAQDVYRFAATENIPPGTRNFLANFTTKGIYNYDGIEEFNESICQKFRESFGLKFVRPILLDGGQRKHTLFLLTRHIRGMMLANKIFWDKSPDGLGIRDGVGEQHLFNTGTCSEDFRQYAALFEDTLKSLGSMNNQQIIELTATHGFLSEHTKKILDELKESGKISVTHVNDGKKGYYIAENNWDKAKSIIKYNR